MKFDIFFITFFSVRRSALPYLLVSLSLQAFPACETGEQPLPEDLSAAYAGLLTYRNTSKDLDSTDFAAGVDSVLASHGFDRESFAREFERLGTSAERVNAFFDETSTQLLPDRKPREK